VQHVELHNVLFLFTYQLAKHSSLFTRKLEV